MWKVLTCAPLFAVALDITCASAQQLTVYTALESDLLPVYKASFEKTNPGVTIRWVRDSTGVITAKLLAEKDNPVADVVLGTAATSLLMLEAEGMLEPYSLHKNIATYTHSGSKPCTLAAAGEHPIGISFEFRAAKLIGEGAPIAVVIPEEGIGWDMEASAVIAGTPNREAAEKLLDWSVSDEAMAIYAENYAILANPKLETKVANLPENLREKLIDNDFQWAAQHRAEILQEWQKRYDGKSEAKG